MVGPEQNCELSLQVTHVSPESTAGPGGGLVPEETCWTSGKAPELAYLGAQGYWP